MSALTKLARGQECQVRIPGVCNFNTETTVLAHYRLAGTCGTGIKPPDLLGAWCCSSCHDACDSRDKGRDLAERERVNLYHTEGCLRTIYKLIQQGKLPK